MRAELLALAATLALAGPAHADDAERAKAPETAAPPPDAALLEFLGEFTAGDEWVDPIALDEVRDRALDRAPKKTQPRVKDGADPAERGEEK